MNEISVQFVIDLIMSTAFLIGAFRALQGLMNKINEGNVGKLDIIMSIAFITIFLSAAFFILNKL